jgi:carboxypeptidase family protein
MRHWASVVFLFSLGCGDVQLPVQPTPSPELSFSLSGQVTDTANRPLNGSRVAVVDGPRAGTLATTDEAGRFSMPGIFTGTITVTASKDGYVSQTRPIPPRIPPGLSPPPGEVMSWSTGFQLEPLGPSLNIAGEYTLTVTADTACTDLPDEASTRIYTATIASTSASSRFVATLNDARFLSPTPWCNVGPPELSCSYNTVGIGLAGDLASVSSGIVEQLGDTTYLWVGAGTQASFGPTGITASLSGSFLYCPASEPFLIDQGTWACRDGVQCDSENHRLTLVRR